MRWWNKEIGALQFTQSPWWRLGILGDRANDCRPPCLGLFCP